MSRKLANRLSAARSRQRKKAHVAAVEEGMLRLQQEAAADKAEKRQLKVLLSQSHFCHMSYFGRVHNWVTMRHCSCGLEPLYPPALVCMQLISKREAGHASAPPAAPPAQLAPTLTGQCAPCSLLHRASCGLHRASCRPSVPWRPPRQTAQQLTGCWRASPALRPRTRCACSPRPSMRRPARPPQNRTRTAR